MYRPAFTSPPGIPACAARARRLGAVLLATLAFGASAAPRSSSGERAPVGGDAASAEAPILLAVGGQREIRLPQRLRRVAIGNPDVADALLLGADGRSPGGASSVLVVARKPGATDLLLWSDHGPAQRHPIQVNAVDLPADGVRVGVAGKGARIEGVARDAATAAAAQRSARAAVGEDRAGGVVIDQSTLAVGGTVQVDVKVIEISKTVLKQAGFNVVRNHGGFAFGSFSPSSLTKFTFTPGTGAPGSGGFQADITAPITSAFNLVAASASKGIFANLSLLEGNGMARVLAEPSLVALSGQSASFLAGGEIPIPVPQTLGTTTIQYKSFGIGLTVTPTVLSAERIALKVAPEASDLDPSRGITLNGASVPAIVTRRADTTVELGDGESFVIGGLVSQSTTSNIDKVPLLGDLPLIGAFFKNLNYHRQERELIIVVTPHLVRPLARGAAEAAVAATDGHRADAPVWRKFVIGEAVDPALPGFSR